MEKRAREGQRGIAATALAIGGLILLTVATIATSVILQKNRQTQKSRAASSVATISPTPTEAEGQPSPTPTPSGEEAEGQPSPTPSPTPTPVPECPERLPNKVIWCTKDTKGVPPCSQWRYGMGNNCVLGTDSNIQCSVSGDTPYIMCTKPNRGGGGEQQVQDNTPPNKPKNLQAQLITRNGRQFVRFSWRWGGDNISGVGYCKRNNDGKYVSSRYPYIACKPNKNAASPFWWHIVAEKSDRNNIILFKCYNNRIESYNPSGQNYRKGRYGCGYGTSFNVPVNLINTLGEVRKIRIDLKARDAFGNITPINKLARKYFNDLSGLNPSPSLTPTSPPPSITPPPSSGNEVLVSFRFKLLPVNLGWLGNSIPVKIKIDEQELQGNFAAEKGQGGVFELRFNAPKGQHNIYIKPKAAKAYSKSLNLQQNTTIGGENPIELKLGDANGDNLINVADLNLAIENYFENANGDVNGDNTTDDADITIIIQNVEF